MGGTVSTLKTGDDYVVVVATLRLCREKAVLLENEACSEPAWVPRSCIYGPDDRELDDLGLNQEIAIRIREWVVRDKGLC